VSSFRTFLYDHAHSVVRALAEEGMTVSPGRRVVMSGMVALSIIGGTVACSSAGNTNSSAGKTKTPSRTGTGKEPETPSDPP
jgi:hypothetical protein